MRTWREFQSFDRPIQVVLANMLINNTGFYMLLPFVAGHMSGTLGFAAASVGLVLGTRTFTQQGMFLVGGTLSDRWGHKPVIVAGCLLRGVGFGLFGALESLPGLVFAAALSGFAAALSTPSVRAYLAVRAGERRPEAFALLNVTLFVGSLLGPLFGALLLALDFRSVAFTAGGLFVVLSLLQWRLLPDSASAAVAAPRQAVLRDWQSVLRNNAFVLFALGMVGYFTLYNQVYLAFPLEIRRVSGSETAVGVLFAASAMAGALVQVPVAAWAGTRWQASQAITRGLALMGVAFAPLVLAAPWLPLSAGPDAAWHIMVINLLPVTLSYAALFVGELLVQPFTMDTVARLGQERLTGTYLGMYYLVQGIGATLGSVAVGLAFDAVADGAFPALPWLLLLGVGLGSSVSIAWLGRPDGVLQTAVLGAGASRR
jgi:dipeptide/tripeptide permease